MFANENESIHSPNFQYDKILCTLKKDLNNAKTDEEKVKIYIKFLKKNMMPKYRWKELLKISNKQHQYFSYYTFHPIYHELIRNGSYYFLYDIEGFKNDVYNFKCYEEFNERYQSVHPSSILKTTRNLNKYKKYLMFPHKELESFLIHFEMERFSLISKEFRESIKKLQVLFWELKSAEDDLEKWLNLLMEVNDLEFVKQNVENRLLNDLSNEKLWKVYIEFWRKKDPKEMLQVYSKYCRYFLDDKEMKEKYKIEVKKYGPIFVKWKNPFKFEKSDKKYLLINQKEAIDRFDDTRIPDQRASI